MCEVSKFAVACFPFFGQVSGSNLACGQGVAWSGFVEDGQGARGAKCQLDVEGWVLHERVLVQYR